VYLASGLRMALAVAVLVPLLAARRRRDREPGGVLPTLDRRDWLVLAGIAVGGMFLFSVFMLSGMRSIPGAVGGVVMATTPAVTAAGSVLFLRDRLDRWKASASAARWPAWSPSTSAAPVVRAAAPTCGWARCWCSGRSAARPPTPCWASA
jgi:drug/metabolite transporter (DMT)-like permease